MEHICDTCEFYEDDKCRFVGWRKTKNEQCLSWREALEPLYPDWKAVTFDNEG